MILQHKKNLDYDGKSVFEKKIFVICCITSVFLQHSGYSWYLCVFVDRELHKDKTCDKAWLCFGNTFIRMPKASARHLLEKGLESLVLHLPDYIKRSLSCFLTHSSSV